MEGNEQFITWHVYENDFYSYTQGLMVDSTSLVTLAGIKRMCNICVGREIYNSRAPTFHEEFRQEIELFSDECENK